MYQAELVKDGDSWAPELVEVIDGESVAPAEAAE
jgi:branched-chain amino acid transport system substrate-binding protein